MQKLAGTVPLYLGMVMALQYAAAQCRCRAQMSSIFCAELYNKGRAKYTPPQLWNGPQQLATVYVTVQPATVVHEHIIIGSEGFWTHMSADDAVLRSHFFVKVIKVSQGDAMYPDKRISTQKLFDGPFL